MKLTVKMVVKEYFNTIAMLLRYKKCDEIEEIKSSVLSLLCQIAGISDMQEECMACIEPTDVMNSTSDSLILKNADSSEQNVFFDIKAEVLRAERIDCQTNFDSYYFAEALEQRAFLGNKNACKLLACLNWTGKFADLAQERAVTIWTMLAMVGDKFALNAVIFAHGMLGDAVEKESWERTKKILSSAYESFVPTVKTNDNDELKNTAVHRAGLIMCISQLGVAHKPFLDRALVHYALHSKDDYFEKLSYICSGENLYSVAQFKDNASENRCGF